MHTEAKSWRWRAGTRLIGPDIQDMWDELHPAEQVRILRLLIERIDVAPDGISVTLHAAGIRGLVADLVDEEAPAPATSGPLLEAAE